MQAEERNLIVTLFERLRPFDDKARDPEAAQLIAQMVARQPAAPYLLTQTVLVQEQALKAAQARIAELEARAGSGGSFLGSAPVIGPWGAKPPSPVAQAVSPPVQPAGLNQGGGFLRSALSTAAGVAGGALLFEGLRDLFGGHGASGASPWGSAQAAPLASPDSFDSDPSRRQEQLSSVDLAQDDGSADDYDLTNDDSSFDDSTDI
jgi:hypothetical protein